MALVALLVLFIAPGLAAAQSSPQALPLFPLPDVSLFPNTSQPFMVFEPRYREMVADALAGDSIIGIVMLAPGFEADYEGRPPVVAIGTVGVIVGSELLEDGRYNLILRGVSKFRILEEDDSRVYRLARVELVPESVAAANRPLLTQRRRQIEAAVRGLFPSARLPPAALSDEAAIDALALGLPLEPLTRQNLLEANGPLERAAALLLLLRPPARAQ
ncbi:MAG: LON peptidase substrate-binding domain-containing protein [Longimicrobiales bacterium]